MLIKTCPICNGLQFKKQLNCKDHAVSQETFSIVSCETCGLLITNPRPKDSEISRYYESKNYISHNNNTNGFFNFMYQAVRKYTTLSKVLFLKAKKGDTILDVGCGTGDFLNKCKKFGMKTRGVEPAKIAREQAIKKFHLDVSEEVELKKYKDLEFNYITMWHALEHVPKLNTTINQLRRILKNEGKVVVAVPNYKSWDAKHYKEYWAAWDVPIHFWHFSKKTIENLFEKHKFILTKTKPMVFDSYYISILSEQYRSGKKSYIKGFVIGLISNLLGMITKNGHSSTIYVFEKKK